MSNAAETVEQKYALAIAAVYRQLGAGLRMDETEPLPSPSRFEKISTGGFTGWLMKLFGRMKLKGAWDVRDSVSLLETIEWLRCSGSRIEFEALRQQLHEMRLDASSPQAIEHAARALSEQWQGPASLPPLPGLVAQIGLITSHGHTLPEGTLGWDLVRAAHLIPGGLQCGYIELERAWQLLLGVAAQTQASFPSWKHMSDSFLVGRKFWMASSYSDASAQAAPMDDFDIAANVLLTHPQSPWVRIPWTTSLS